MATKGSNGVQDGLANVEKFTDWQASVEDFRPYVLNGELNISMIRRECGFSNRGPLYTNTTIRDDLLPKLVQKLLAQGVLQPRGAEPARIVMQERRRSPAEDVRTKQLTEQNEALTAENRALRGELSKLKVVTDVLYSTGRVPF